MATGRRNNQRGAAGRDVVVSGVDTVTDIGGGLIRVVFYINRRCEESGRTVKVLIRDAVVMPASSVPDGIGKSMMAIGRKVIASEERLTVVH